MSSSKEFARFLFVVTLCATIIIEVQGQSVADKVKFYVYTRQNLETAQALEADVESVVRNVLNPTKPTTLAIHHMLGDKNSDVYSVIRDTKLQLEDGNVIIVDYSDLIEDPEDYVKATSLVPQIAEAIADLVVLLQNSFNMDLQQLHVVGFSLGGQISGLVGQHVYQRLGEKVARITALDPAGILFTEITPESQRLSPDDGQFVEVVHTNAGQWGFLTPCGHVDYYPNGGKTQPGCTEDDVQCSHNRAYQLIPKMWSSVENHELLVLKCSAAEYLGLNECRWLNEKMGDLHQRAKEEGVYYVETNSAKPYGKGAFKAQFL